MKDFEGVLATWKKKSRGFMGGIMQMRFSDTDFLLATSNSSLGTNQVVAFTTQEPTIKTPTFGPFCTFLGVFISVR